MKKLIVVLFIIAALCVAATSFGGEVGISLDLTVDASSIVFSELELVPEQIVTNQVFQWLETTSITTNGMFSGGEIVTNNVQRQVVDLVVVTNAAYWQAEFPYTLPSGTPLNIEVNLSDPASRIDCSLDRKAAGTGRLILSPAMMSAIVGPDVYAALEMAASNFGPQPIRGRLAHALQAAVAQAIGAGQ